MHQLNRIVSIVLAVFGTVVIAQSSVYADTQPAQSTTTTVTSSTTTSTASTTSPAMQSTTPAMTTEVSKKVVQNLDESIDNIKKTSQIAVLFPSHLPVSSPTDKYYLTVTADPKGQHYYIDISISPDCKGAHYCSIGEVYARAGDTPQMLSDTNGKQLTTKIKLSGEQSGFYTPGHAEADYAQPQVEFQVNNVLYGVWWNTVTTDQKPDKEVLTQLADSMLKAGAR